MIGDAERVQELERENAELRERAEKAERRIESHTDWYRRRFNVLRSWVDAIVSDSCGDSDTLTDWSNTMDGLRLRAEKAERDLREEELRVSQLNAELNKKHDRLARYEAPGPALLAAKHSPFCSAAPGAPCAVGFEPCRTRQVRDACYREQHARCVAVVQDILDRFTEELGPCGYATMATRAVLAALTGEVKP